MWHFGSKKYSGGKGVICRLYGYDGDRFTCYFYAVNWFYFSLGLHVDFISPNIEIHLPVGFLRIGWKEYKITKENT